MCVRMQSGVAERYTGQVRKECMVVEPSAVRTVMAGAADCLERNYSTATFSRNFIQRKRRIHSLSR